MVDDFFIVIAVFFKLLIGLLVIIFVPSVFSREYFKIYGKIPALIMGVVALTSGLGISKYVCDAPFWSLKFYLKLDTANEVASFLIIFSFSIFARLVAINLLRQP